MASEPDQASTQYLAPEAVLESLGQEARRRVQETSLAQIAVLAVLSGAFIAFGALFSVILSTGVEAHGPKLVLQGQGFSAGFFFVILSHAVLFTGVNVMVPARFLAVPVQVHCARIMLFDGKQPLEIDIGSIHHAERTGPGAEQIQNINIVQKAVGDQHKRWVAASEIEQGVDLDGNLGLSIIGRREQRQAKADDIGIEGVDNPLEIQPEIVVGIKPARCSDQRLSKLGNKTSVNPKRVGHWWDKAVS